MRAFLNFETNMFEVARINSNDNTNFWVSGHMSTHMCAACDSFIIEHAGSMIALMSS